jgi:hypothetical protein
MLPLECHYVAEIRYQESVAAARPPHRHQAIAALLSRWRSSWRRPSTIGPRTARNLAHRTPHRWLKGLSQLMDLVVPQ